MASHIFGRVGFEGEKVDAIMAIIKVAFLIIVTIVGMIVIIQNNEFPDWFD